MAKRKKLKKEEIAEAVELLLEAYPDAKAELDYTNPYELLIATILSAQCTDVRVNKVTKVLFKEANSAQAMCLLPLETVEKIIKPCGLYKTKAQNIKLASQKIMDVYGGEVPPTIEEIMTLPGAGRKTANVVASNAFDVPAIAVDTHVFRVANRLGLTYKKNVLDTEKELMRVLDKKHWTKLHHCIIFHGRRVCKARKPMCEICTMNHVCREFLNLR